MGGGSAEGNTMKHISVRSTATVAVIVAAHEEGCATGAALANSVGAKPALGPLSPFSNVMSLPVHIFLRRESVDVALGTATGL
jgi:hypothetical protein